MIVLGLTGGIGAGKSFIAKEFEKLKIPVYNSDNRAKELMLSNNNIKKALIAKFGIEVYANNKLNRKLIADQIFTDKSLIDWINNLVHPVVANDFDTWANKQNCEIIVNEAAILIESGAYKQCNKILVVTAPENIRIERIAKRDNMTQTQIRARINNQITDKERLIHADYIIKNDGTVVVSKEVEKIIEQIKK